MVSSHLVCDPAVRRLGFGLLRWRWSLLGCFCTKWGHCGACRDRWRLADTGLCPCGETWAVFRVVESCPPDGTWWRLVSAALCRWRRCFVAGRLWFMTRTREEEVLVCPAHQMFFYDDALHKSTLSICIRICVSRRRTELTKQSHSIKCSSTMTPRYWLAMSNNGPTKHQSNDDISLRVMYATCTHSSAQLMRNCCPNYLKRKKHQYGGESTLGLVLCKSRMTRAVAGQASAGRRAESLSVPGRTSVCQ